MSDKTTEAISLLRETEEYVEYVARESTSEGCGVTTGIAMTEAARLRAEADRIERRDKQIRRARALLPKVRAFLKGVSDDR